MHSTCMHTRTHIGVFMQEVVTATIDLEDIRSYRGCLKNYQVMLKILCTFLKI